MKATMNGSLCTIKSRVENRLIKVFALKNDGSELHLATQGAFGMPSTGFHSHHGDVIGNWLTLNEMFDAYGILTEEIAEYLKYDQLAVMDRVAPPDGIEFKVRHQE